MDAQSAAGAASMISEIRKRRLEQWFSAFCYNTHQRFLRLLCLFGWHSGYVTTRADPATIKICEALRLNLDNRWAYHHNTAWPLSDYTLKDRRQLFQRLSKYNVEVCSVCGKHSKELAKLIVYAEEMMKYWHNDAIVLACREAQAGKAVDELEQSFRDQQHEIQIDTIMKKHRQRMLKVIKGLINDS